MIRCNLAVILAEKNMRLTQISQATGLSRTTLSSLAYNYSKGIQFDTLNTICTFLNITPNDLIDYVPVDIAVGVLDIQDDSVVDICLKITERGKEHECSLAGSLDLSFSDRVITDVQLYISLWQGDDDDSDLENENKILIRSFKKLNASFRNDIESEILDSLLDHYDDVGSDISYRIDWDDDLLP